MLTSNSIKEKTLVDTDPCWIGDDEGRFKPGIVLEGIYYKYTDVVMLAHYSYSLLRGCLKSLLTLLTSVTLHGRTHNQTRNHNLDSNHEI